MAGTREGALKAWDKRGRSGGDWVRDERLADMPPLYTHSDGREFEVRQGRFAATGKVAVKPKGAGESEWSNWADTVEEAIANRDKLKAEAEHNARVRAKQQEITDRVLADVTSLTTADIRVLTNGYAAFSTGSAKAWLSMAGFRPKDADRILRSPRVGSLGQSRGGANLFDARSLIEEAARSSVGERD